MRPRNREETMGVLVAFVVESWAKTHDDGCPHPQCHLCRAAELRLGRVPTSADVDLASRVMDERRAARKRRGDA